MWSLLPFNDGVVGPHAGRQQVVPVVEQLVVLAAVTHPDVGHAGDAAGQAQQVLPGAAVLVSDEQALVRCLTLGTGTRINRVQTHNSVCQQCGTNHYLDFSFVSLKGFTGFNLSDLNWMDQVLSTAHSPE